MDRDQKWIRAILRHGSAQAADELVRAHYDGLFAFLWRQSGSREDAQDLTQESFIAALRALPRYDPDKGRFTSWLYCIASHKYIDAKRRQKAVLLPLEEEVVGDDGRDLEGLAADRDFLARVEDYVRGQDPELQQIYRLRLYGGLPFGEIARLTGQSEEKQKARYYRLLARLRKEFGEDA